MAGHETHSNTGHMKCYISHYAIELLGVKPSSSCGHSWRTDIINYDYSGYYGTDVSWK